MRNPMGCPSCGCLGPHNVSHTRHHSMNFRGRMISFTRRRKICRNCRLPYWTREIEEDSLDELLDSVDQAPPPPPDLPEDLLG